MTKRIVTIGSDPEIGIQVPRTGKTIAVCGLMGGEKGNPIMQGEFGGWLEDGIALELNPKPATTVKAAIANLHGLMVAANAQLSLKKLAIIYPITELTLTEKELKSHPAASVFGCAADLSAYAVGSERKGIMEAAMKQHGEGIRFYGGHVHLGVTDWPEALPKFIAVRLIDLLLGLAYLRSYTRPNHRDPYYGLPGLYRETSYGIEYRTPGNEWLQEIDHGNSYMSERLLAVGKIFADFENTGEDLVRVYNEVNWDMFAEGIMRRDWSQCNQAMLNALYDRHRLASAYIKLGNTVVPIFSLDEVSPVDQFDKSTGKGKPKPTTTGLENILRADAQVLREPPMRWFVDGQEQEMPPAAPAPAQPPGLDAAWNREIDDAFQRAVAWSRTALAPAQRVPFQNTARDTWMIRRQAISGIVRRGAQVPDRDRNYFVNYTTEEGGREQYRGLVAVPREATGIDW